MQGRELGATSCFKKLSTFLMNRSSRKNNKYLMIGAVGWSAVLDCGIS